MRALPGLIVGQRTECLQIKWAAGEREHRYWLAHPYIVFFEPLLKAPDLISIVVFSQDEICLHPWNAFARVDEQLGDPLRRHAAVFVQLVATCIGDALDPALHRNGARTSQQVE